MDNLVKEWPFLFVDIGMLHHFKLLTNIDIMNALEQSMTLKGKEKISFLGSCTKKKNSTLTMKLMKTELNYHRSF